MSSIPTRIIKVYQRVLLRLLRVESLKVINSIPQPNNKPLFKYQNKQSNRETYLLLKKGNLFNNLSSKLNMNQSISVRNQSKAATRLCQWYKNNMKRVCQSYKSKTTCRNERRLGLYSLACAFKMKIKNNVSQLNAGIEFIHILIQ